MNAPRPWALAVCAALCAAAGPALAQSTGAAADDLEALLAQEVETAATYRQEAGEAAASVTVVTADEIERAGYRTLADILATVRGVYLTDDRASPSVGVRGVGSLGEANNRIALFIDGVPARNGFNDAAPVGFVLGVPLTAVDRVEFVRGPGSTLYGTGAMAGVVNVILKDTRTLDGARGAADLGSYESYGAEAIASTDLPGGWRVAVTAHGHRDAGPDVLTTLGFPTAPGTAPATLSGPSWERSAGVATAVQRGSTRLDLRLGERDAAAPAGIYFAPPGPGSWLRDRSATASLRTAFALSPRLSMTGTVALDHYHTDTRPSYAAAAGDPRVPAGSFIEIPYRTNATGARAGTRVQWDASAAHRVVAGAEVLSQFQSEGEASGLGQTFFQASDPFAAGAVYAQSESALGRAVSLTAGARLDAVRGDLAVSPRGAVVVTPDDRTVLKLVAGSAFRSASSLERTLDIPEIGQVGAVDLRPERVTSYEAVAAREVVPGFRVEGSLFSTYARDLIENRIDPAAGTVTYVNVGRTRTAGAEVGATGVVAGWRTRASYGYQRVWDPETDAPAVNAPRHLGKATAFGPLGGGVWLSIGGQAEGRRQTLYGTTTGPFAVVDAALSADAFGGVGRITAGVRNAFDADYAHPARPRQLVASVPQRPRTIYLRFDVRL